MTEKDVATLLVRLLTDSHPRPLKGSELSVLVKTSLKEFSPMTFGCKNLRDFIRKHTSPKIAELGKAGMDIIYGLPAQQQPLFHSTTIPESPKRQIIRGPLTQLLSNPRVWKTFASPDSPFQLYIIPSSGDIRVLRLNDVPEPSWQKIESISAEKLLQIGKDFVSELPELQRNPLQPILEQPKWWIPYFEMLQTLGVKSRWVQYRRRRIAEEFERSVPKSPVPQYQETRIDVADTSSTQPPLLTRRIAAEVVRRMTDSELRALNLPLGYVVDALTAR